jgi:hypothetical protein
MTVPPSEPTHDLDAAVDAARAAAAAAPSNDPERVYNCPFLSLLLRSRYARIGAFDDLNEAIDVGAYSRRRVARWRAWSQTVSASPDWLNNNSLSFSAGVIHPSTLRGLVLPRARRSGPEVPSRPGGLQLDPPQPDRLPPAGPDSSRAARPLRAGLGALLEFAESTGLDQRVVTALMTWPWLDASVAHATSTPRGLSLQQAQRDLTTARVLEPVGRTRARYYTAGPVSLSRHSMSRARP